MNGVRVVTELQPALLPGDVLAAEKAAAVDRQPAVRRLAAPGAAKALRPARVVLHREEAAGLLRVVEPVTVECAQVVAHETGRALLLVQHLQRCTQPALRFDFVQPLVQRRPRLRVGVFVESVYTHRTSDHCRNRPAIAPMLLSIRPSGYICLRRAFNTSINEPRERR